MLLNTLVHVLMYSYYGLSALGPRMKKYLWWKKYLTQLQLAQFFIYGVYGILALPYAEGWPRDALWMAASQPPIFFVMFFDFYRKSYGSKSATRKASLLQAKKNSLANNNTVSSDANSNGGYTHDTKFGQETHNGNVRKRS